MGFAVHQSDSKYFIEAISTGEEDVGDAAYPDSQCQVFSPLRLQDNLFRILDLSRIQIYFVYELKISLKLHLLEA